MNSNKKTLDLLRELDAAPTSSRTSAEILHREALLVEILTSLPESAPSPADSPASGARLAPAQRRVPKRRTTFQRRASLGIGALLVGAAAIGGVVAIPHYLDNGVSAPLAASGSLTTMQLASWTSTPASLTAASPLATQAQAWCESSLREPDGTGGTPTITNVDVRGEVVSMIYERDGLTYYCLTGGPGKGMFEIISNAPPADQVVAPTGILLDTAGSVGSSGSMVTYVVGFAGADVTGVTMNEPGAVVALVEGGRWTAWWPTSDEDAHGGPVGDITISTADGQTQSVTVDSIRRHD